MCHHCSANDVYVTAIERWADDGLPCTSMDALARPSAVTEPNTFVFRFANALPFNGAMRDVFVDAHYYRHGEDVPPGRSARCLLAIGGLWMRGVPGDMKPNQHGGELRGQLLAEIPGNAPTLVVGSYGGPSVPLPAHLTTELAHEQNKTRAAGTWSLVPPRK